MTNARDTIVIEQLELSARVGITAEERASPQRLTVSLQLEPVRDFSALDDRIENTVDYFQVCLVVQQIAAARPRNLIETLAGEIANGLLEKFALSSAEIELRKFILPNTAFVAVKLRRSANASALSQDG